VYNLLVIVVYAILFFCKAVLFESDNKLVGWLRRCSEVRVLSLMNAIREAKLVVSFLSFFS